MTLALTLLALSACLMTWSLCAIAKLSDARMEELNRAHVAPKETV